jgi:ABC-2 type transport system ATP-binding protein
LALAFVGNPELVFLDEPTSGLDIEAQERFQTYARDYVNKGGSLILTSHNWAEIEHIADKIIVIDRGEKIIEGSKNELHGTAGQSCIELNLKEGEQMPENLSPHFNCINAASKSYQATTDSSETILKQLYASDVKFENLTIEKVKLATVIENLRKAHTNTPNQSNQKAA